MLHLRRAVPSLSDDEFFAAFLADSEKSVASHFLDSLEGLFHKLEELLDDGFKEVPISFEKFRVLTYHIHDVRGDHSLVLLSALLLAEGQQALNCMDQKLLFVLIWKTTADGTYRPANAV